MENRIKNEILHSQKIKFNAEEIWGWSTPAGKLRAERRAQYFIQTTGMNAQHRVLEIGCGSGVFTEKLAQSKAQITAVDVAEDLLAQAKDKHIPNCTLEIADAHNLHYGENSFDIVCGSSVLHHLEIDRALREIYRVVNRGGKIIFSEPNMLNPINAVIKNVPAVKEMFHESPDETAFFRWPLKNKLVRVGFIDVSIIPYDFLHPSTPVGLINLLKKTGLLIEKTPLLKEFAGSLLVYGKKS